MLHRGSFRPLIGAILGFASLFVAVSAHSQQEQPNDDRLHYEEFRAAQGLLLNLSHPDVTPGAVIASPSKVTPNYFYHWVRDASLTMNTIVTLYKRETDPGQKASLRERILRWVRFEGHLQTLPNRSGGLGEPKFMVNGTAYTDDWGRPQNDGPALRALTMMHFMNALMADGLADDALKAEFYSAAKSSYIKNDLEYVAHHWQEPSFDLWEEVKGDHFYTRMVQRAALYEGSVFAHVFGDTAASDYYLSQSQFMDIALTKHIDESRGLVEPTLRQTDGWSHKSSGLDIAVALGVLHAGDSTAAFGPNNPWVQASLEKLERVFKQIYPLNRDNNLPVAIGRYPEDVYDGTGFGGGNPWFIATHAYAEIFCKMADAIEKSGQVLVNDTNKAFVDRILGKGKVSGPSILKDKDGDLRVKNFVQALRDDAVGFLHRSSWHTSQPDGAMSEQFSRYNGYMMGAADLTWSYASYLTAYWACEKSLTH